MGYLVTALMSFIALVKKNSKFIFLAFLALLWVLFVLCIDNPDLENYKIIYDHIDNLDSVGSYYMAMANESGFRLMYKICFALGMEYRAFLAVFAATGLAILGWCIWKYSENPNVVLFLYAVYPFTIDYVQIRSFMSMIIVLYALQYLIDDKKVSYIKFTAGVLLASTMHVTALFYIVLIIVRKLSVKECWYISIIGILGIVVLYLNIDFLTQALSGIIPMYKIKNWLSGEMSRSLRSVLSTLGLRIGWIALQAYFFRKYKLKVRRGMIERDKITENLYKCNIMLLVTLGFEIFKKDFERLGRISFILGYILFTRLFSYRKTKALPWMFVFGFMGVYFIFFMFFSETGSATYFDGVFKNLFENNLLFNRM